MIYISHGEKGGVGKSRLAMLLVDILLQDDKHVVIVEGDKSGADLGLRYNGAVPVEFTDLNRPEAIEEAFADLGSRLEKHPNADVVINLPGQASKTIDGATELLVGLAKLLDQELFVFYSIGNLDAHVDNFVQSVDNGITAAAIPGGG